MRQLLLFILLFTTIYVKGQIGIKVDDRAAEQLLQFLDKADTSQINNIVQLPANQIMEQLYVDATDSIVPSFKETLYNFIPTDSTTGIYYNLYKAYKKRKDIRSLLDKLQNQTDYDDIINRALYFFPTDYKFKNDYNVFYSLTGWKWGDAQKVQVQLDDKNDIVSLGTGKPALIFNLRIIADLYGKDTDSRIKTLKNVMSHEIFHALLDDYSNDIWKTTDINSSDDFLRYYLLNEGIAHYITQRDEIKTNYKDFKENEQHAFDTLNVKYNHIHQLNISEEEKIKMFGKGLYGRFWNKYICISGMFMAYHIENILGIEQLRQCINKGFNNFIETYNNLATENDNLHKANINIEM
ncbi:MAG: DUF5700 domain-containing putative Zn-dependent protease [Hyphomicrobiales bacterium]